MAKYRNAEYFHKEWIAYNGNHCSAYTCNDVDLLRGYQTVSFPAKTEAEMKQKIDHYIDNRADILKGLELERKAAAVFYETLDYKGD